MGTRLSKKRTKHTEEENATEHDIEPKKPSLNFFFDIERKVQTLFILQALILTALCFHSILLLCVSGWTFRSDVFVGHWTHSSHPYLEITHTVANTIVFAIFARTVVLQSKIKYRKNYHWLAKMQTNLNRFNFMYSFLCFFDGTLLFFTDTIFLFLAVVVFMLRYWQLHLVGDMSLAIAHLSTSVLVEDLLHHKQTKQGKIPQTLVKLFDLRKASIRASVLWSCLLTLYNITSNLSWLAFGSRTPFTSDLLNQTLLPRTEALFQEFELHNSVLEDQEGVGWLPAAYPQTVDPFLWHQTHVPEVLVWAGEDEPDPRMCTEIPVVLPEPVSIEHSLSFLGRCGGGSGQDQGVLSSSHPSDKSHSRLNGLRFFQQVNADFLGLKATERKGCPVVSWAPHCSDSTEPCTLDQATLQTLQNEILQSVPPPRPEAGLVWHIPIVNPTQEPYRQAPETILVSLSQRNYKSLPLVSSKLCLPSQSLPESWTPHSLPLPLGWFSQRLQHHGLQYQTLSNTSVPDRRRLLLRKALHAALQVPYLLHSLEKNRYWVFCSSPELGCDITATHLSELDAVLSLSAAQGSATNETAQYASCLRETEFWVHLQLALYVLETNTLQQDGLFSKTVPSGTDWAAQNFEKRSWPASWQLDSVHNASTCKDTKQAVLSSVLEDLKAWSHVMQRAEPQMFVRNWLLTLFFGAVLLRKAHVNFLRYNLVPLHAGRSQVKSLDTDQGVVLYFTLGRGAERQKLKLRLGEKTGSGALLLYTLHQHVWKNVLIFTVLVLSVSLLLVALLTSNRHPHSLWPTHAWFFNALVNTNTYTADVRSPGLYFFLLLVLTVLCAALVYGVCSLVLKPIFFFWLFNRLKKKRYPHTEHEDKAVVEAMYLRTFAMHEGLVFNCLVVLGWTIQCFYSSPWPWKYTPWFLLPTQAWDLALFVNCVYMPIVLTFGLHYVLECVAYESLFWKRASPNSKVSVDTANTLGEEQKELEKDILEGLFAGNGTERKLPGDTGKAEGGGRDGSGSGEEKELVEASWKVWLRNQTSKSQRLWFAGRGSEWIPELSPAAERIISESFLALLVLSSFDSRQSGSSVLLVYHDGLLKQTVQKYTSLRQRLLKRRFAQLSHDLELSQTEHDRLHELQRSYKKELMQKLY